jgi:LysM repeat protein
MMKKIIYSILFSFLFLPSFGQMKKNTAYLSYIEQYKDLAIEQMLRFGIPASITLSQGLLESRAGMSDLAIRGNNHFGIKCHDWNGKTVYHDDDAVGECFRAYSNVRDSYEDHSRFLKENQRYRQLFSYSKTDYYSWAYGLKAAGYATNPKYPSLLINIIQLYNLDRFDGADSYDKFMVRRSSDRRTESSTPLHPIYIYNKNYYLYARQGDTFKSIGEEVGISYRKIAKYNERDRNDVLTKGDIIYLKKKQKRAMKTFKNQRHIVNAGESMYSISQRYGIRLESLYKMNNLPESYEIQVGDALRVY